MLTIGALPAAAQSQVWIRQLGTIKGDSAHAAAPDGSGGAYVSGFTAGNLGGPNAGYNDAWLARYDSAGAQLWLRQFGTTDGDVALATAPDGSGGVYVGGGTAGDLGGTQAGFGDAWLARYDSSGAQLWIRQLGSDSADEAAAAALDGSGGVYLSGYTVGSLGGPNAGAADAWLARYDSSGVQLWIRQLGTSTHEYSLAAVPDGSGGVYLSGHTDGSLGGPKVGLWDAWLARYDSSGAQLWIRQLGTSLDEYTYASASDGAGGVYVSGQTFGNLGGPNAGGWDVWLARYDSSGAKLWILQLGTSAYDFPYAATPDGSGGVHVSGSTNGSLGGPNAGSDDVWIARYDSTGSRIWIRQFGSNQQEFATVAAPDGSGGVHVGGYTYGSLSGPNAGMSDAWLSHYEPCSPPATYCTAKVNSLGCTPTIAISNVPSASPGSYCTLSATNVISNKNGLFFHSTSGLLGAPFHGGYLCVKSPTKRHAVHSSGGTSGTCDGVISEDFNAYIASGADPALVAGAQVWIQKWSRDPADVYGDSLSDAVTATICP